MKKKKGSRSLDQFARTFSLFAPPKNVFAPVATDYKCDHFKVLYKVMKMYISLIK